MVSLGMGFYEFSFPTQEDLRVDWTNGTLEP